MTGRAWILLTALALVVPGPVARAPAADAGEQAAPPAAGAAEAAPAAVPAAKAPPEVRREVRVQVEVLRARLMAEQAAAPAEPAKEDAQRQEQERQQEQQKQRQQQREQQRQQQEQMIDQQAKHWEGQLANALNAELQLIRATVGDLPPAARRAIVKAGQDTLKTVARDIAARQMRQSKQTRDVMAPLFEALAAAVAEHAGAEAAARYRGALEQRALRRRDALVAQVVALIDGEVYLTVSQREELTGALTRQWQEEMAMSLIWSNTDAQGRRTFPGLSAELLRPILTQAQRSRIGEMPRGAYSNNLIHFQLNQLFGNGWSLPRDGWWYP